MTEAEWLPGKDPRRMLRFLEGKLSDRKFRLFLCGGCRRVWKSLSLKPIRRAVEAAEQFADGAIGLPELCQARDEAATAFAQSGRRNFHKMTTDPGYAIKAFKMTLALNAAVPDPGQVV